MHKASVLKTFLSCKTAVGNTGVLRGFRWTVRDGENDYRYASAEPDVGNAQFQ